MGASGVSLADHTLKGSFVVLHIVINVAVRRTTACIDVVHSDQGSAINLNVGFLSTDEEMTGLRVGICVLIRPSSSSSCRLCVKSAVVFPELVSHIAFLWLFHNLLNGLFE